MFSIIKKYNRNLNNICKIREKGVSLISLIVIIIVLLILAGVTIKIPSGDSGLIKKTKKGVAMYQNASVNESETLNEYARKLKTFVEVPKAETIEFKADITGWTTKDVTITATSDDPDYEIELKSEDSDWSVRKDNKITVSKNQQINARLKNLVDKYSEDVATYNVTNIDKDAPDKTAPALKATTNSITVTFKQKDDGSGIAKREYSIDNGATWKAGDSVFTFSGLTQGKKYEIITRATDRVENQSISDVSYITTETIPAPVVGSNLTFTPSTSSWTNSNVSVAVSTTVKGYTLQTSTDGKTWGTTNPLTYSANGTAYARLWDGNNASAVATTNITNIDKLAPTNTAPTVATTTNKITITNKQVDQDAANGSGKSDLNASKTQYRLVTDTNGTTAVTGKDWQSSNVFSGLTQNTTYYVQTKVTDNAGNTTTSAVATAKTTSVPTPTAGANVIFTPSTSNWTNGNVNVTVSTTITGFTLQTSTDGKTWSTTNPVTYSANGTAYARLWDGNNASAVATTNITNIDKLAPTNTAPTVETTTNKITITNKQVDQNAANGSGKSDLNASKTQYRLVTDTNGTTAVTGKDWQSSNVFSGLTQNTTYYVQTKVTDNAGNTTTSAVATAKTTSIPTPTTGSNLTFTPSTSSWTNGNVNVTVSTTITGFTLQTSTDGKTWGTTNPLTYSVNGTAYARLWDGNNASAVATTNITNIDKLAPTNTAPTVATTTNKITITNKQVDQDAANGSGKSDLNASKTQYRLVTDTNGTTAVTGKDWQSSNVFSGLTQNTTYYVQTKVTDNAGNTTTSAVATAKTTSVPTPTTGANVIFTPSTSGWTNGNVNVTVSTTITGFTLQTSTDGKTWSTTNPLTYTANGTAYARLWDGNNASAVATTNITNIDKLAPTNTAPTVSTTTNRMTITNKQVDQNAANGSGKSDLNASKTQYRLVTDTNGTTAVTGKDWQSSNVFSGLTQNTTYYVQTKVTDNAGNTTTSAVATAKTGTIPGLTTGSNLTFTPSTSSWTNGNVSVNVATTITGYTLQTSTDGKTWGTTNPLIYSANGTAYARLWDGNNASAVATTNITNIDKLAPTNTAPTVATTTNKITATLKQVDQNAANGSGKSDLNASKTQYRLVTDTNGTTAVTGKDWQSSNVFSGLTQNTTYYVQTKVTDNAGNTTTSAVATAKTAIVPSGTTSGVITLTPDHNTWTNTDVKVTATTNQTGYTIQMSTDGKTFTDGTSKTLTSNGTVYARLRDSSNNYGASATISISIIDKVAPQQPQITAKINNASGSVYNSGTWTNQSVYVELTSTDDKSGIKEYQWYEDNAWTTRALNTINNKGTIIYTADRNLTIRFRTVDKAGNISNENTIIIRKETVKPATTAPTTTNTTNSITVTNKQTDNESGIASIQYQIKKNSDTTWGSLQSSATFGGLTQNTKYDVRTHAVDKAGNASDSAVTTVTTGTIPGLTTGSNLTFTPTPSGWTNGNVSVAVSTTIKGYTLQTSTDGKTWGTTNPLIYSANGTAYARLWDGNNASAVATTNITNIDKLAPTNTAPTVATTTNKITITNKQVDQNAANGSGKSDLNASKTQYRLVTDTNGTTAVTGKDWQSSNVFSGLTQNTTYYVQTKVTDNAGNTTTSAVATAKTTSVPTPTAGSNLTFTPSTSSWTNGNVSVKVTTTVTGYTLQTSTDGKSWSTTNPLTYSANGTAYARLWDGNNASAVATTNITNIDKLAPTNTAPTVATTTNKITITNKQVDQNAANGSGKSDLNASKTQYRLVTDTNGTTAVTGKDWQSSNVFSGLTQNTTYYVQTKVTDNAGNTTTSAVATAKTTSVPTPTAGSNLTFTPSTSSWTNGNVSVNVATTVTGYTLQTSTDGKTWSTTNPLIYSANGTAYARLWDGNNASAVATTNITNIDKLAPTNTAPTVATTTNRITITNKQVDQNAANGSGKSDLNASKTQYRLVTDTNGTTAVTGKDWQSSNVFSGLTQNTTYYVQTKVTDNAGNTTTSAVATAKTGTIPGLTTGSNLTFTPTPSAWTNGNVSVKVATTITGYTLQTSTDGKTWGTTNPLSYSTNGTAYARLWDGNNASAVATTSITNIDKTAPSFNATVSNVSSSGYDVIITGVSDTQSGINRIQCPTWTDSNGQDDLDGSWSTSDKSKATKQADGSYKFRVNITDHKNENGKYITHVYGYDNVGNNKHIVLSATVPQVNIQYMSGNLVNDIPDSQISGERANAKIENNVVTLTALKDDGYEDNLPIYVQLEANKKYHFSCEVDAKWKDTAEAFIMYANNKYSYYMYMSDREFDFTPTQSGNFVIRLDVNQSGKTCTFKNIQVYEYYQQTSGNAGSAIGTVPVPTRAGYTFNGWFTDKSGGTQITTTSTYPSNGNATYYSHWTLNKYYYDVNPNAGIASFDITYGGTTETKLTDFYRQLDYGTQVVIKNVVAKPGYTYTGYSISGTLTKDNSSTNQNIITRLGAGNGAIALTGVDKTAPTTTAPTATTKTNSITVANKQADNGSGIASIQYQIKKNSDTTWGALQSGATFNGLTQNTKYDVRTHAVDKAGNASDSAVTTVTTGTIPGLTTGSNLTFTPSTSSWTNGNVNVTVSTTITGFTLQTSTDGKAWSTTNPLTYSANGTAYARLWDGNNASAVATTNITNIDKLAPTNTAPTVATTTNKITITNKQVDQNAGNGSGKSDLNASKTQYRLVTDTNGTTAVTGKDWQSSNVFSGLTQNTTYYVQTKVTDNAGNTTTSAVATAKTGTIPTPTTGSNLTFTPSTSSWTNGNVSVAVSTTVKGYTLQTSTDGKSWGTTNPLTYTANGTAYARLWDGNNASAVATTNITNIDKLAPTNTAPTVATTTNKITVTLKQVDQNAANGSGKSDLNASKTQYRLVTDTNGTTAVTGKDWQSSNVFSGLTQNTTYYVQTKVTDNAGNTTTSAVTTAKTGTIPTPTAGSNLTFTPSTSSWTNGNVSVKVSTTVTGYTLQTSTDGKSWGTTNPLTYSANGTAYARLWDGNNASAVATTNITNIDKLAPTNTAPTVSTTTNRMTITNKQVDQNAANGSGKSDLNASKTQYRLVTDTNGTTAVTGKDWQSSNVFSGLTQNTTYYVQTKVTDNAGNTTTSAVATVKTTSVPTPTTGSNLTFTPTPSGWTNGNVSVKVSTTVTGYTLQTSTDGKTWGITNPLIYSANGTAYARLWDGNNASAVATTNITNIDKTAPSFNAAVSNVSSTGYDVIITGVSDTQSGVNRIQCPTWTESNGQDDIDGSWTTSSKSRATKQSDGSYKFRVNITDHKNENGKYITHVYGYDNVGNNKAIALSATVPAVTITWNANGGTAVNATSGKAGNAIGTLPTTTRTGYTFAGWFTAASGGTQITTTSTYPTSGNVTYYAHWNVNQYAVTCEDWFVDSSNNRKVKLGSASKNANYGTTVNGSEWGTEASVSKYYSSYVYKSSTSATVGTSGATVYRYFYIWIDVNILNPSGVQDYKSAYFSLSNDGTNWDTNLVNESSKSNNLPYGTVLRIKDLRPYYSYYEYDSYSGCTYSNGQWTYTATAPNSMVIKMKDRTYSLQINPNGGTWNGTSAVSTLNKKYSEVTSISAPTRTGYTFMGFSELLNTQKFNDGRFDSGNNGVGVYNNKNNGQVTVTRQAKSSDNPIGGSYELKVTNAGQQATSPNLGGFVQTLTSEANKKYVHLFIAKLPAGYYFYNRNNSLGNGSSTFWLTSNKGTGNWQVYAYQVNTGSSGTFSTFGHVDASPSATGEWIDRTGSYTAYLAFSNIYDITTNNTGIGQIDGSAVLTANWIANTYKVQFNGNGATSGSMADETFTYNKAQALTTNAFGHTGYTFTGWSSNGSAVAKIYDNKEYTGTQASSASGYLDFKQYSVNAPFASGDVYQLDVDVKGSGTLYNYFYGSSNYLQVANWKSSTSGKNGTNTDGCNTIPLTNSYAHYTVTFTLGSSGNGNVVKYILFRAMPGCTASIKNVKLHKISANSPVYMDGQTVTNLTATNGGTVKLYATWVDVTAPTTTAPTATTKTNSITVTNRQTDNGSGIASIQYQIKKNGTSTWGSLQSSGTFTGLTQNTKYDVRTHAVDKAGNASDSAVTTVTTGTIPGLTTGSNLTFTPTPSGWTNGNVSVKVSTTVTGYTLQTSTDGKAWSTTNPLTYSANGTAYARLWDGNNASAVATTNITNIDKLAPTNTAPTVATTTNKITATLKQVDQNAGSGSGKSDLNASKTQYRLVTDTNGTTAVTGKDWQSSNVFSGLTQNTTYYVQTKVTDNAGNTTTSAVTTAKTTSIPTPTTGSNLTFTPSTSSWTNGNVSVAVSTTVKGYTLQTSTDGKTWSTTNPLIYSANGTAYARLWDGNNASAVATTNITNIDKTAPSFNATVSNVSSTGYDVIITGVSDTQSGVNRIQCPTWTESNGQDDIDGAWSTSTKSRATKQADGSYKFRVNITDHKNENGKYITHVYGYDNVGNNMHLVLNATVPAVTITWNANGGTAVNATSGKAGNAIGTLPTTTRTGYTFAGWFTAASGGTQITTTSTYPTSGNVTYYAHWNVNQYSVTCEDWFVDSSNNRKVKLGSASKNANYGTTVNGSEWGTDASMGKYYSSYVYKSSTSATVGTSGATVYRYFWAWTDLNVFYASGSTQGGATVSLKVGNGSWVDVTNESNTTQPYGTTYYIKNIRPKNSYEEFGRVENLTWDSTNSYYSYTPTKAGTSMNIYMKYKVYYYDVNPNAGIASFDITYGGTTETKLTDFYRQLNYGTQVVIKNVVAKPGYTYTEYSLSGTLSKDNASTNQNIITTLGAGNGAIALTGVDKTAPTTTAPTATTKTNSITVTNKQTDNGSGIASIQYQIKKNGTSTWGSLQSGATFNGLTQNTKYDVRTHAVDKAGNASDSAVTTVTTGTIPTPVRDSNVTFTATPSGWTHGNVSVKVATTVTGYTLQTSTDGKSWGTTNPLTYSANGTAYARLWDGNNASAVATTSITNIDKLAPTNTAPTVATTTNRITITNKQVDQNAANGSGKSDLNASKTQYRLVTNTSGTTAVTGKDWQSSNVFSGLTQNTAYYVQTKVTDNAGNTTTSAVATAKTTSVPTPTAGSNLTFTPTPSGWTNGNVSVKVTTTVTGYTLQTSTDGKSWGTTNPLTYSANGTAYARLWDGNNASAVATTSITNIDKLAPTNTAPTVATTTNKITATLKQADQNAANGSGKSDLNASKTQYRLVTDTKGTTAVTGKDWQSGNVFSGLTQNTTYYVQTKVIDNAGNTTTSAVATAKTGTIPTPVRGSNVTFTATPTTKTSGNVTVKVSTTVTGYTLQTSTNGSTWGTTNPLTFTANGTAYARLWDGNNASAVATFNITNIDKTNYSISYNLNGGSASGNPTSYKVDSSTITINAPTRVAYKFLGWTGSNDLSSGLGNYTSSSPYVAASRDHILGNEFNVTAGEKYRVFVRGTRTKGNLNLQGGIWYTAQTSGKGYDGYGGSFTEIETGLFYKEITIPTGKTKGKFYIQLDQDTSGGSTSWKLYDMHVIKVENPTIPKGSQGNKSFTANWKLSIDENTPVGTKVGTTVVDGQTLDWYLFDTDTTADKAYLVSTPTLWVPDTTKEVNGAYTPKLVSAYDSNTNAMRQAIQKLANGTNSYSYLNVTYKPSDNTLNYFKSANSQWSAQRGSVAFADLKQNEQAACYLADGDIFAGIKSQVNNADGNLKVKIQTLVGGASAEQWCKAYNKQAKVKNDPTKQITCEYQVTNTPGYIYKVNGTAQNSGWWTNIDRIYGDDIYGAADRNYHLDNSTYPFSSCYWWLASPSSYGDNYVCVVERLFFSIGH